MVIDWLLIEEGRIVKHHRFSAEQIVNKLRQADVLLSQGQTIAQASKALGVTEQIYHRWRKEFGGLKTEQAKRLKELERENARLKRLLADAEESKLDSRAISKSEIRYKLRQFSECARISLPMRAQNMFASRYDRGGSIVWSRAWQSFRAKDVESQLDIGWNNSSTQYREGSLNSQNRQWDFPKK